MVTREERAIDAMIYAAERRKLLVRAYEHEAHALAVLQGSPLPSDDEMALVRLDLEMAEICRRMALELDGCNFC